jgi:peptide/nickel transport system permease protein
VMGGVKVRSIWDWGVSLSTVIFIAIPNFVFGIVLLWLISYRLGWLPVGGRVAIWDDPVEGAKSLILAALTLGLTQAAVLARYTRTAVSQVTHQQYVTTARAKGLAERTVIVRHVLKNSLIPTITLSGLQVAAILTGSVVVERVFSRPGLGRIVVDSVQSRDIPAIQGVLLVLVAVFILVNLVADLLYGVVDPRIRLES